MDSTDLYQQILGLNNHWTVTRVKLNMDAEQVTVRIGSVAEELHCPECNQVRPRYDRGSEKKWRHLDTCQMETIIISQLPRIECSEHGVKTIACPWAAPHGRFTLFFEAFVISLLQVTKNQTKTADLLNISFDQIHHIMERAVERGLQRRDNKRIHSHLGIDEKSMKKRHKYITVLSDSETGAVIDVSEGRTIEKSSELITSSLTQEQRGSVKTISMDMWEAFAKVAKKHLNQALIIHDRFHIAKYLTDAVDSTRRSELSKVDELKGQKYNFIKNFENLTDNKVSSFALAYEKAEKTANAWTFKELFRDFFTMKDYKLGRCFFRKWCYKAARSKSTFINKVSKTFRNHSNGILNYLRSPQTNSKAENVNGTIQMIKVIAKGFRRFENFRIAILFHCGQLDLDPRKNQ